VNQVVKLRWQYGVDGAWRALGTGGRTYVVEPNAQGFSAAVRLPQGRLSVPLAIDPLGVASTATQCQWLCEQHQDGCR
jgi:hypothetical protein